MLAETQGGIEKIKYAQNFGPCSHFDKGDKHPYCIQFIEQRENYQNNEKLKRREKKKVTKLNSAEIILLKN